MIPAYPLAFHQCCLLIDALEQPPSRRIRLTGDKLLARNDNLGHLPFSLSESCPRRAEEPQRQMTTALVRAE